MATVAENLQILKDSTDAIKLAIIDKGGKITGGLSSYADAISKISIKDDDAPSDDVVVFKDDDVVFYDYDGTVLHSYTKDGFLALTSLPILPSHPGLICQGWNWNLEDAKEYVQEYGRLNIGATYITDDGKTRLYINLLNDKMSVPLYIKQSEDNGVTVEWGDGNSETVSGTDRVIFNHMYNEAGSYTISLTVNSGTCTLGHNHTSYNVMGSYNTIASVSLYKAEIGSSMSIGKYALQYCYNLQSITIPNSITLIDTYALQYCYNLQSITIPNSITLIGYRALQYCYNLQSITIPNSITRISGYTFNSCYSLQNITILNSVTNIDDYAFYLCYSLQSITIPNSITLINGHTFYLCYSLQYYDFTSHTSIPTLSKTLDDIKTGYEIRVPAALYEDWVNATNWSKYKDYIIPIGSNIKYFIFNAGGQYKKQYFEDGMTWGQWVNSPYNKHNKTISDIITPITESDLIIENSVYDLLYGAYIVDLVGNLLDPNTFTGTADDVTGIGLITDNGKWIVALDEWHSNTESTAWNGNIRSAWGGYSKKVTDCWTGTSNYLVDFDGEANTDAIITQLKGTTDSYSQYYTGAPAAEYCRSYSKGYKDVGSWYLPAAGELNEIALNKDAINTILTKLGKNSLSKNSYTWSSSQYNSSNAWYHNWSGSNWYNNTKHTNRGVRPICAF